jgi:hypothetical protein
MTDSSLSPAAQAVKAAAVDAYWLFHPGQAAAALRAAVAHTQQHRGLGVWECDADELLAIASELDNNSTH